jgi:signal transduction histidine kinase
VVRIEPTVELFREGEPADFWWVVLDGAIDLVRHIDREDTVVARMDAPGRWAGGFRAWDQQGVYLATGRGVITGRVLRVPADVLRDRSNAWFPFAAHLVEGLYHTARLIESTARQRESLVTLGTLAAGLAHELNNPASAATRAVDELEAASQTMLASAERLIRGGISAERFAALDALRREIEQGTAPQDPIKVADREEVLSSWLVGHDVAREWVIAPVLAAAGVDVAWCERAATVLTESALEPGLEWVSSALSVASLLSEVKGSTRRVSELVAALRSYSQMDRAAIQLVDITDGIESTLAVLGQRLTDNISVVRDYGTEVPRIEAYAGELNQVWTKVIENALDALDDADAGTLRIRTRADGAYIVVEIGDTGIGMSPAVAARAFDAFYTTKPVGKGAGLGLDIARRIVNRRHGGTISIASAPGETVLQIRIPVTQVPPSNAG